MAGNRWGNNLIYSRIHNGTDSMVQNGTVCTEWYIMVTLYGGMAPFSQKWLHNFVSPLYFVQTFHFGASVFDTVEFFVECA